jgi:hypothetical protein
VFWFENDADPADPGRLLVAQTYYYAGYGTANQSLFSVYRASDLTQIWPTNDAAGVTWDTTIVNVYDIVTLKVDNIEYIYGIDYDNHKVFRVKIDTDMKGNEIYTFDSTASYSYTGGSTFTFGQDIETDGVDLFALFLNTNGQYGGPYAASTIVRLSPDLSTTVVVNSSLKENAMGLTLWTGDTTQAKYFYIPAIGGEQHYSGSYNTGSVIQRIAANFTSGTVADTLLINDPSGTPTDPPGDDTTDFYGIAFETNGADTGKAFILKGVYTSMLNFTWRLYGTTLEKINAGAPGGVLISSLITAGTAAVATGTFKAGYLWALFYNAANDNVWFVRGNEIVIYNYNATPVPPSPTPAPPAVVTNAIGMGADTSFLAPVGFNLNMGGAAIYGIVGAIGGGHQTKSARQAAAAAKGEEEK